jgi:quercetin dioxygenase-like cupin family protein
LKKDTIKRNTKVEAILQTPLPRGEAIVAEEILYLMSDRVEHSVEEKKITASAGDVFTVGPGVYHQATNTGSEDAHMIVAYSEGNREMQLKA